jgi:biopolymer transport protein ExbD
MKWRIVVALLIVSVRMTDAHPYVRHLQILPNGHVRFDNGPELDLIHLRLEIRKMSNERPQPNVSLLPDRRTNYANVAAVLVEFQRAGYNHLGFTGIETSN